MSFKVSDIKLVYLTDGKNKYAVHTILGKIVFHNQTEEDINFIHRIFNEAQIKFKRMHAGDPVTRFDKSWTGVMGEAVISYIVEHFMKMEIVEKASNINRYNGGDIWVKSRKQQPLVINVSSRKLSRTDTINSIIVSPDKYFALIPVDQFNQYKSSQYAFFTFLKPTYSSVCKINKITVYDFVTAAEWAVPGYLKADDLKAMYNNGFLLKQRRGEEIRGLYGDMTYAVSMYTDNYLIFINMLRKFKIDEQNENFLTIF